MRARLPPPRSSKQQKNIGSRARKDGVGGGGGASGQTMALTEPNLGLNHGAGVASCPSWKLYYNPHYLSRGVSVSSFSSRSPSRRKNRSSMIVANFDDDGGARSVMEREEEERYGGAGGVVSASEELELCLVRVEELRAELDFERRMRRKVEALNEALAAELAEERRRGGTAEAECARMREEAGLMRAEMERVLDAIDEERRMLRVAELWREERVKMKLADARAAVEERLQEIADAGAVADGRKSSSSSSSPVGKSSTAGQQSPTSGQPHRRDATGGENPHIRRGIKGFVEFPRGVRVRPREERVDLVSNLECQRAQLRVLMRHRSPAAGVGLVGAPENLVV